MVRGTSDGRGERTRRRNPAAAPGLGRAVARREAVRQGPAVPRRQPQPQQVPATLGLGVVRERRAIVQDHVVVDELDVARGEVHVQHEVGMLQPRVERVQGRALPIGQRRHAGEPLRRLDEHEANVAPPRPASSRARRSFRERRRDWD